MKNKLLIIGVAVFIYSHTFLLANINRESINITTIKYEELPYIDELLSEPYVGSTDGKLVENAFYKLEEEDEKDMVTELRQYGLLDYMQKINLVDGTEYVIGTRRASGGGYSKIVFFRKRKDAEKYFAKEKAKQKSALTGLSYIDLYESRIDKLKIELYGVLERRRKKGHTVLPVSSKEMQTQIEKYGDTPRVFSAVLSIMPKKKIKYVEIPKKKKKRVRKSVKLRILNGVKP